jgi:co-chaperonin GroES (HSP10)
MSLKLRVPGHKILIKPDPIEVEQELSKENSALAAMGFKVADVDGSKEREKKATTTGTLVAVGPMAWKAFDGEKEGWEPWAQIGEKVMFGRYAGDLITHPETKEEYMLLNDEDLYLVLETNNE